MTKKRVLVTGASGFLGRPLVGHLLEAGYAVRAATRGGQFPKTVEVATVADFATPVNWNPIVEGIDIVIHLAGLAHMRVNPTAQSLDLINHRATRDLARTAAELKVERFLFISSVRAQAGGSAANIIRETDEPRPTNDYGRSKLAAEFAIRTAGVPFTVLRPVAVYGPNSKGNIETLARVASTAWPLPLAGFTARRCLLGINNFLSAVLFILSNPKTIGETYLLSDSKPFTVAEIVTMMRKAQGRRPGVFYFPPTLIHKLLTFIGKEWLWRRMNNDLVVDTSKLQTLGWRPPVDTYAGIASMMQAERHVDLRSPDVR